MEHTWKSSINRHTMDYLHPNPFYLGVVRMLLVGHEVRIYTVITILQAPENCLISQIGG